MSQTAIHFLLNRRSFPSGALKAPAPEGAALERILTAAARVPDHGGLEPWRFVVIGQGARARLAELLATRGADLGIAPEKIEKSAASWRNAPLIVAVVSAPVPSDKAPEAEQVLSAGAVCVSLVNAALATGWAAAWITGWAAFDRAFIEQGLGLSAHESIAGFIHLGSAQGPVPDRKRPDLALRVSRLDA